MNIALTVFRIKTALDYFVKAKDEHALHSPFVYDLYTHLIRASKSYYDFEELEIMRREMLSDTGKLQNNHEPGAGHFAGKPETVRQLVKKCSKSKKTAYLLYKLSEQFGKTHLLELGTSVGLTAAYLGRACPAAQLYTLEGNAHRARQAENYLQKYGSPNTKIVLGNIDVTLPGLLQSIPALDVVFFDANHRYQPTINYYQMCQKKAHNNTVFIFDDIRWSPEMYAAWTDICHDENVTVTIDLGEIGLVFFRKEQPKQHFVLKF